MLRKARWGLRVRQVVEGACSGELEVSMLATSFVAVVTASAVLEGSSKTQRVRSADKRKANRCSLIQLTTGPPNFIINLAPSASLVACTCKNPHYHLLHLSSLLHRDMYSLRAACTGCTPLTRCPLRPTKPIERGIIAKGSLTSVMTCGPDCWLKEEKPTSLEDSVDDYNAAAQYTGSQPVLQPHEAANHLYKSIYQW